MTKTRMVFGMIAFFLLLGLDEGSHEGKAERRSTEGSLPKGGTSFSFGLIGDIPYSPKDEEQFPYLIQELNKHRLAFVVHVGDIKRGGSRCDDKLYLQRLKAFQASSHPFILMPGDNEWTDCHRVSSGGFDPQERLVFLRKVFFSSPNSLGQKPMPLFRQSQQAAYQEFVENVRWSIGPVLFFGLHIVGSNNNLGRTPKADAEYRRRNQANLVWMRETFQMARDGDYRGVVMFIHGNPFEPEPDFSEKSGFRDFLRDLEMEVREFDRPVVLVHGDTHYFRIDKPLPRTRKKPRLMSFTRVETFASPDLHWIRVGIDLDNPNLFSFEPEVFSR